MVELVDVYRRLRRQFGPQRWWPGDSRFEIMVGAILTQNTNWNNVESALQNLRNEGLLTLEQLDRCAADELAELIRPAGYYRLKARRLKNLTTFLMKEFQGSIESMLTRDDQMLRRQLLQVNGIGPETADSILLYALGKPTFVVDAYTARVVSRHAWLDPEADYHQIQSFFLEQLPIDAPMFNEYHALIVRLGKDFCRKQALCEGCPLEPLLPEGRAPTE